MDDAEASPVDYFPAVATEPNGAISMVSTTARQSKKASTPPLSAAPRLGTRMPTSFVLQGSQGIAPVGPAVLPDFVDWVAAGAVPAVKSQGRCGSCWAFSAASTIETANAIATGTLTALSEQQLLSCNSRPSANSCDGGYVRAGLDFAIVGGGLVPSEAYPYTGVVSEASLPVCLFAAPSATARPCVVQAGACSAPALADAVKMDGWRQIKPKSETELMAAVAQGSVSVIISGYVDMIQHYGALPAE